MATPARQQYLDIKSNHPNDILLFRMGDFYETFDDDAKVMAKDLEIALTSREMGKGEKVPLAGIPYHSLNGYLSKLVSKGHRIAICEQTSDPSTSKGIVDREVVRIVTPGTITEDQLLETNINNYLASIVIKDHSVGVSYVDITTTEFLTTEIQIEDLTTEINRINPRELIISKPLPDNISESINSYITLVDEKGYIANNSRKIVEQNFRVASLESFGCDKLTLGIEAAAQIIEYLKTHQRSALRTIPTLKTYSTQPFMSLDQQTSRNLEIFSSGRENSQESSLYSILDKTQTPMGGRLLRKWLGQPLLELDLLEERQKAVEWFIEDPIRRGHIAKILTSISDIERLTTKVKMGTAGPRDLTGLGNSLEVIPDLIAIAGRRTKNKDTFWVLNEFSDNSIPYELIKKSIEPETPPNVGEGRTIKPGFSRTLDLLKQESTKAKANMANIESREREKTGIKSLKIGYNRVFGYYLEVSKSYTSRVPSDYVRRQTLVGGERYITPEMKKYESIILNTSSKIEEIEKRLFEKICSDISIHLEALLKTSYA
ncbi:MAG TPA: DNA mismatch repair protein MutS, partial [Dehalococcoidia bacterium]|nr:DNA mismatch repair protein MutS [Dehalococcoidia bacterium]